MLETSMAMKVMVKWKILMMEGVKFNYDIFDIL
jgi:hypothetical protein